METALAEPVQVRRGRDQRCGALRGPGARAGQPAGPADAEELLLVSAQSSETIKIDISNKTQ